MDADSIAVERSIPESATIHVENVGGIDRTEVRLERGITVLSGRNATNRTSLLTAIMAALGSDVDNVKADATSAAAVLEFGDETYRRTLTRKNGTVVADGEPYLDDAEVADLFAFLLESNELRRAVARGAELRELLMRPVDTDEIRAEIDRRIEQKDRIDERLDEPAELETRLPALESERDRLTGDVEDLRSELDAAEAALEESDRDAGEARAEQPELEATLEELQSTRTELDRVSDRIETERESIEALTDERETVEATIRSFGDDEEPDRDRLEAEIDELQAERDSLETEIGRLQNAITFNERLLEDPGAFLTADEGDGGSPTDELLADSTTVACWTCGSSVPQTQIETTIEQLRSVRTDRLDRRAEIDAKLDDRRRTLAEIEDRRSEYRDAKRRREQLEDELSRRRERLDELTGDRDALTAAIRELEEAVETIERDVQATVLDRHRKVNELEFELERTAQEREDVDERIADIEDRLAERERLETRREELSERLAELRTRIDRIETEAVAAFNEHMANILELLDYGNLDRIWLDRTARSDGTGRGGRTESRFELKIVRRTDDGAAYEDSIDHLSESEREVTGLVFTLAGYLVHDVHETVPFVLLDSLEAIDADRIAALVEYFDSHVPYVVVALLREDAATLEAPHEIVTEI